MNGKRKDERWKGEIRGEDEQEKKKQNNVLQRGFGREKGKKNSET